MMHDPRSPVAPLLTKTNKKLTSKSRQKKRMHRSSPPPKQTNKKNGSCGESIFFLRTRGELDFVLSNNSPHRAPAPSHWVGCVSGWFGCAHNPPRFPSAASNGYTSKFILPDCDFRLQLWKRGFFWRNTKAGLHTCREGRE